MAGKGDRRRPYDRERWAEGYERTFGSSEEASVEVDPAFRLSEPVREFLGSLRDALAVKADAEFCREGDSDG